MLELSLRKHKIHLPDTNYQQDIESRILLADFSVFDVQVLEEILFSPLKIPIKKLSRSLECAEEALLPIFKKLSRAGLVHMQDDMLLVDKERRKYFEFQICRFNSDFHPDMEFFQGLLKLVPIHVLPVWYSIPRTSNNILDSIVEKYLLTPQIYQRYLADLSFADPVINSIVRDVFASPELRISSSDLIAKYNLARRDFEEIMLQLEFNMALFVCYEREDDHWIETVSPFYEWSQYLLTIKEHEARPIKDVKKIVRTSESDFGFIEELESLLKAIKKKPTTEQSRLAEKLCLVRLAERSNGRLAATDAAAAWLNETPEERALYLYRHSANRLTCEGVPASLYTERHIKDVEKTIKRVLHGKWVYFDDFIHSVLAPLNDESAIVLKRMGKHWKYTFPEQSADEKSLIHAVIFEWLYECGMVATGHVNGRECFAITPFGSFFFED